MRMASSAARKAITSGLGAGLSAVTPISAINRATGTKLFACRSYSAALTKALAATTTPPSRPARRIWCCITSQPSPQHRIRVSSVIGWNSLSSRRKRMAPALTTGTQRWRSTARHSPVRSIRSVRPRSISDQ